MLVCLVLFFKIERGCHALSQRCFFREIHMDITFHRPCEEVLSFSSNVWICTMKMDLIETDHHVTFA